MLQLKGDGPMGIGFMGFPVSDNAAKLGVIRMIGVRTGIGFYARV